MSLISGLLSRALNVDYITLPPLLPGEDVKSCSYCHRELDPSKLEPEKVVAHEGNLGALHPVHRPCFDAWANHLKFKVAPCQSGCGQAVDHARFLPFTKRLLLKIGPPLISAAITTLSSLCIGVLTKSTGGNFALAARSQGIFGIVILGGALLGKAAPLIGHQLFTRSWCRNGAGFIATYLGIAALLIANMKLFEGLNIITARTYKNSFLGSLPVLSMLLNSLALILLLEKRSSANMPVTSLGLLATGILHDFSPNLSLSIGAIFTGAAVSGVAQHLFYKFRAGLFSIIEQ